MACDSCHSVGRFRVSYCDECERWTFNVDKYDLMIAAGLMAIGGLIVLQPELLAPAGVVLARRAIAAIAA